MALNYKPITWTKQKKYYDLVLLFLIIGFFVVFGIVHYLNFPQVQPQIFIIRSTAFLSFILLHIILWIGPLARINKSFLILLYNRRHLGVVMFLFALIHGFISIIYFHGFGNENPILSVFISNLQYDSLQEFPFQVLGLLALVILFFMAATSHDFWLHNLSPRIWKAIHMLVYLAYISVVLHVLLGYLQSNESLLIKSVFIFSIGTTLLLHLLAGILAVRKNHTISNEYMEVKDYKSIKDGRAKILNVNGNSIAVFRFGNQFAAVDNICKHQQGPLGEGRIVDGCITCPWHGYQYKPEDGCSPPPYDEKVLTFPLKFEGAKLYVSHIAYALGQKNNILETENSISIGNDDPFFVGWAEKLPKSIKRKSFLFISSLFIMITGMAFIFSISQENYKNSEYVYGKLAVYEGIYIDKHVPMLQQVNNGIVTDIMLVDFGKFSAERSIKKYEAENKISLNGLKVKIRGTKIKYNNKTLIELAERENAIIEVQDMGLPIDKREVIGPLEIRGEIIDPKCFFGVMNPAEGKIHKSCAIRCISGGIPAVIRKVDGGQEDYYIIKGSNGNNINQDLLPYVGEEVRLKGVVSVINNWNYLTVSNQLEIQRLSYRRILIGESTGNLCFIQKKDTNQ